MSKLTITIAAGGRSLTVNQVDRGAGLFAESLKGWYGTPKAKVEVTERASGDGAHFVPDEAVLYASRVVTIGLAAYGNGRPDVVDAMDALGVMAHHIVEVTVEDGGEVTTAYGYLSSEFDDEPSVDLHRGTATIVCADPRRYGVERSSVIVPFAGATGGLQYDADADYILLPITFAGGSAASNATTVTNGGNSEAFPVITVEGDLPSGITLTGDWGQLVYASPIGIGAPLVLDSLTRTATVLGVDVTRALTARDFPTVPAQGSATIAANADGTGTATINIRDTYI